jgi:pyruvate dehydrogenase E2 component (dihydrolipoamide acetyltransferase)
VVEILVSAGDEVGEDDPLIVIESDKASMEVPAGVSGKLDSIEVAIGDKVQEGQVIARISRSGAETSSAQPVDDESSSTDPQQADEAQASDAEDDRREDRGDDESTADDASGSGSETVEVRVPDIGEAENVEVIEVAVKAGDQVSENDLLVVVESDKASMEIPSTRAGKVVEVHVSEGSAVEQGTLLVTLEAVGAAGRESATEKAPRAKETRTAEKAGRDEATDKTERPGKAAATEKPEPVREADEPAPREAATSAGSTGADVYAGPAVRRLARELGVDLRGVQGSGGRGRIVKDDVKAHVKSRLQDGQAAGRGGALPALPEVDFSKFGEVETQALSRIRARGAENLHRAGSTCRTSPSTTRSTSPIWKIFAPGSRRRARRAASR